MKMLKRKYDKGAGKFELARTKVANRIALWMSKLQTAFANSMDKAINPLSLRKKKFLLYSFCCLISMYCLWLVLSPFVDQRKNYRVEVQTIQLPKLEHKKKESLDKEPFISTEQYDKLHDFKLYLDSLSEDKQGSILYDSILVMHPGIMDSLKLIEEYYQLQK